MTFQFHTIGELKDFIYHEITAIPEASTIELQGQVSWIYNL